MYGTILEHYFGALCPWLIAAAEAPERLRRKQALPLLRTDSRQRRMIGIRDGQRHVDLTLTTRNPVRIPQRTVNQSEDRTARFG